MEKHHAREVRSFPRRIEGVETFINSYVLDLKEFKRIHESIIPLFVKLQEFLFDKTDKRVNIIPPKNKGILKVLIDQGIIIQKRKNDMMDPECNKEN